MTPTVSKSTRGHAARKGLSAAAISPSGMLISGRARPPRFDEMEDNYWAYERGRLWAVVAPVTMDPHSQIAVRLFEAAVKRRWII